MDSPLITFRPLARTDLRLVRQWLNTPHVYAWWGAGCGEGALGGPGDDAATLDQVEEKYGPTIDGGGTTHRYVIEVEGAPIGLIQWYRLADFPDYARDIGEDPAGAAGIDLFIGEVSALGRGVGSDALRQFVMVVVFRHRDIERAAGGPALNNVRSIRAFEKAGFTRMRDARVPGEKVPEAVMVLSRERRVL
jgi:RimJ/RimL family protein N-acetyltransferase